MPPPTVTHGKLRLVPNDDPKAGPPRYAWAVVMVCFGAALVLVAILLSVTHPEWF